MAGVFDASLISQSLVYIERTQRILIIITCERIAPLQNNMNEIKSTMYSPQEIQLAQEMANSLNDQTSMSFYLACTKKYSHRQLRKTLAHVLSIPKASIRKSRGALFNHLVSQLDHIDQEDFEEYEDTRD